MSFFEIIDRTQESIKIIQDNEPDDGYILAFSGGKDSCVLKKLAEMAGVKFTPVYKVTGIDHPELCRFIRKSHTDVIWEKPEVPFFQMIKKKGLPMRTRRWCCSYLKEHNPPGSVVLIGVRRTESRGRKNRQVVWACHKKNTAQVSPILQWTDEDVWKFIKTNNLPYCSLYDKGYKRLGCIGCPMSYNRKRELEAYPKFKALWRGASDEWFFNRKSKNIEWTKAFENSDEFWNWWLSNKAIPDKNQTKFFK